MLFCLHQLNFCLCPAYTILILILFLSLTFSISSEWCYRQYLYILTFLFKCTTCGRFFFYPYLVNIVEKDFFIVRHIFRGVEPGRQFGSFRLRSSATIQIASTVGPGTIRPRKLIFFDYKVDVPWPKKRLCTYVTIKTLFFADILFQNSEVHPVKSEAGEARIGVYMKISVQHILNSSSL